MHAFLSTGSVTLTLSARTLIALLLLATVPAVAQDDTPAFPWPDGRQAALSLTFDDGRTSQVDVGLDLFARHGARATFYVLPYAVERRPEGWRRAVADGHEIGNHSLRHPCTGNFPFSKDAIVENYTLTRYHDELVAANVQLDNLLGVEPVSYAYPCGQTFVGKGHDVRSTVPVVAGLFQTGRGWLDEGFNDPAFFDFAQVMGFEMDGKTLDDLLPMIEQTREHGGWLVLVGHEIGTGGRQTTLTSMLEDLLTYTADPANGLWLAPVAEVADHVARHRPSP